MFTYIYRFWAQKHDVCCVPLALWHCNQPPHGHCSIIFSVSLRDVACDACGPCIWWLFSYKKKTAWIMETYGNQASIQVLGTGAASVWPCSSDQQALDCLQDSATCSWNKLTQAEARWQQSINYMAWRCPSRSGMWLTPCWHNSWNFIGKKLSFANRVPKCSCPFINGNFRILKWRILIYGRYLQFRILEWPLNSSTMGPERSLSPPSPPREPCRCSSRHRRVRSRRQKHRPRSVAVTPWSLWRTPGESSWCKGNIYHMGRWEEN